jgi:CelD/BcsL family acetyltransferase involved in cellulose biosynthesis
MKMSVVEARKLTPDHVSAWRLLQRADSAFDSPWMHPELTIAVAESQDNIEVTVLEDGGEYVGFFPFHRGPRNIGQPIAACLADVHGLVVRVGADWNATELLRASRLTAWHFDHLIASQRPFQPHHSLVEDSFYMDLSEGFDAYQNGRKQAGSSVISESRRKSRKMAREVGELRFEMHTNENDVFAALIDWKRQQLHQQKYLDVFQFGWVVELMQRLRVTDQEGCRGVLSALYAGDRLAAVQLGLRNEHVFSGTIPTFNAELAKYSPGLLLHMELAKQAAEMGIRRIDLGRGYNRMKASLMSGAFPVAVGTVDGRPLRRALRSGWYVARSVAHSAPLRGTPLRMYRQFRNWLKLKWITQP